MRLVDSRVYEEVGRAEEGSGVIVVARVNKSCQLSNTSIATQGTMFY